MQGVTTSKLLLRPAEAADAIGVSRSKAYELIASGQTPSIRVGGSVRVPIQALQEWIEAALATSIETRRAR
jgi:excisionase family DNA binding protein